VVDADDKKRARLNCLSHILASIPYQDIMPPPIQLPKRKQSGDYQRPAMDTQTFVPEQY